MTRHAALMVSVWMAAAGCSRQVPEQVQSEAIVPVTVVAATRGAIRGSIAVTGTVTAAPGADQVVIAPQPARIAEIPKAEGDQVSAGDVLVRFELPALAADVASRGADLARAHARLQNARAAQTRAQDLFDRGVAARKEVEDADRNLAEAHADVAAAQATLGAAQTSAGLSVVRARFSGVVAKRYHNAGELVDATAADPVIRIVDPKRLEITASVPIPDVPRIKMGAAGRMAAPGGGGEIDLKVISRPAAVDRGTGAVPIRLAFAGVDIAPVGTPVLITIDTEEHKNVVRIPAAAVLREGQETAVLVAMGEKAQRKAVTLGLDDGEQIEIKTGIAAGDMVIVKGQAGLPDGARITTAVPAPKQ